MHIEVSRDVIEGIEGEALAAHPSECCGIMVGEGDRIRAILPARNVHATPDTHFEIDPQVLIDAHRAAREGGPQVVGYYHSHPDGPAEPSRTDIEMAAGDDSIWAIAGREGLRFWRSEEGGFVELPHRVVEQAE